MGRGRGREGRVTDAVELLEKQAARGRDLGGIPELFQQSRPAATRGPRACLELGREKEGQKKGYLYLSRVLSWFEFPSFSRAFPGFSWFVWGLVLFFFV